MQQGRKTKNNGWTEVEVEALKKVIRENPERTYDYYARQMEAQLGKKYTGEQIRGKLRRNNITYLDQKNAVEHDVGELLNVLIEAQKKLQDFDDRQTEVTIDIDDDKPIGIVFSGDWHIGGLHTDHQMMIDDFSAFAGVDGLYVVGMGDYCDNYITRSHAGGMFDQIINADKQREICEHFLDRYLKDKLLVLLKGNHDNWSVKETGEDFVRYLARKTRVPYLWYGGAITLRLDGAEYLIHAHHSYRYNSSINTTNSQRNLFNSTHADVIALGHLHYNETHSKSSGGKDTVWIRTGSYKITDDYGQWIGGLRADPRSPMVVLYPKAKKILDFRDYRDGIEFLKHQRGE
jgi:predicted phosphodiesterase